MKRVLCISENPIELREFCRSYDFALLRWPEGGVYGRDVRRRIEAECSRIGDLDRVQCVICEHLSSAPVLFQLRRLGYRGPVILVPHINPYPLRNFLHTLLCAQVWAAGDTVIAGSPVTARRYESLFSMKACPMPTFGIDTALFFPVNREHARKALNLPDGPILLYTGRLAADKNIRALLAVYASLRTQVSDLRLVMAISLKDEAYGHGLSRRLRQVTVLERVEPDLLRSLYSAADLFVSCATSYFETFGRSPLEAIACGTPVVVPDWDGFSTYVDKSVGKLVPVDFVNALPHEGAPYAMVNLPTFVGACLDLLSSPPCGPFAIEDDLTMTSTCQSFNALLAALLAERTPRMDDTAHRIRAVSPLAGKIVDELGITSADRLFGLTTCAVADLPHLDPALEKELYVTLFGGRVR